MATLKEVAELAHVSIAAASRILNGDKSLSASPETKTRVFEAARSLGYKKKSASGKSVFSLGIVQWFSAEEEVRDSYYRNVRRGIEDFCTSNSIEIIRCFKNDKGIAEKLKSVNGIICIGKFSEKQIEKFIKICRNIVFLDMDVDDYDITSLSMDFKSAVYSALDYLVEKKHTGIAYFGGVEHIGDDSEELYEDGRKLAYVSYMEKHGLYDENLIFEGVFTPQSGFEMMKEMLERFGKGGRPTAVFAASDAIAIGAMKAASEAGLEIPEDISILGFNDEDLSAFTTPALTTIHAPSYDMGQHGANLVYVASNLSIKTPLKAKIPCYLVERNSCAEASAEAGEL